MTPWRDLPSLTALRAFEAAARNLSFSVAARELNVTHAAVAQQVRGLETRLAMPLIFRQGRGLALTAEGARLAQAISAGFRGMADTLAELAQERMGRPLRITMTPAFATEWLVPRLGQFWARHSEIALQLRPEQRLVDLRAEKIDLAIRFGTGKWPGVRADYLASAHHVIVAAPELLGERRDFTNAELSAMPWVLEQDWPEAMAWLQDRGLNPEEIEITWMPNQELALAAARQGLGLHVEAEALVAGDVQEGRLVALGRLREDRLAYYLVTQPGPLSAELQTFIAWLKSAV